MTNAERKRELRKNPEYQEKERKRAIQRYHNDPKQKVRMRTRKAARAGIIKKQPCAFCASEENIEKHHLNYQDELWVLHLCAACHRKLHRELRKKEVNI